MRLSQLITRQLAKIEKEKPQHDPECAQANQAFLNTVLDGILAETRDALAKGEDENSTWTLMSGVTSFVVENSKSNSTLDPVTFASALIAVAALRLAKAEAE